MCVFVSSVSTLNQSQPVVEEMSAFDRQAVGARGGGYGLDAELARKREAEYDCKAEDDARVSECLVVHF